MLDIPNAALLDKRALIGGCVRLHLPIDATALAAEVAALPASVWGSRGGRVGPHDAAEAIFLRGFAPAEGNKPVADRPALDALPYLRSLIETLIPAPPLRCLIARLPPGATIVPHVDIPPYFGKTLRVHVPVESNDRVYMMASGLSYKMKPGDVWVLNNSASHAVWNAHASAARTHMICDFLPTAELRELLRAGDRDLGEHVPEVERHFADVDQARKTARMSGQ